MLFSTYIELTDKIILKMKKNIFPNNVQALETLMPLVYHEHFNSKSSLKIMPGDLQIKEYYQDLK